MITKPFSSTTTTNQIIIIQTPQSLIHQSFQTNYQSQKNFLISLYNFIQKQLLLQKQKT